MDKEAENMEEIPSSLSLSMHTEVSEIINTDVSESIDETVDDLDELMYCDDLLEEEEDTGPRPYSTISEESGTTYPSPWCCSPDSEISEIVEPFHQNIDEVVRQVCQSFLYPEYLETEAEAVQTPEPTEAVRTPEPTEAVRTPEPTEAVRTPEPTVAVRTPEPTEAVRTPEPTEAVRTPEPTEAVRTPEPTVAVRTPEPTEAVQTSEPTEAVQTSEPTVAVRTPEPTKAVQTPEPTEAVRTPEPTEAVRTPEPTEAVQTSEPTEATMISRIMDKEAENMEEIPSSLSLSMHTEVSEIINIDVSESIDEIVDDLDELMYCDDLLEEEEDTGSRPYSTISEESGTTYPSPWCCSPDSEISEMVEPFHQNIDEVVRQVCQSFFYPEYLETEAEAVQTPEPTEAVRTPEPTEAVQTPEPTEAVRTPEPTEAVQTPEPTEAVRTPEPTEAVQTPEPTEAVRTPEPTEAVQTPEPTEAVRTPEPTEAVQTPEPTEAVRTPEPTEAVQTPEPTEAVQTPEPTEAVRTPEPTEAVQTPEPTEAITTPKATKVAEVLTEDNDVTPVEIRDIVPSPLSASSPPSALQVVEIHQPQSQLLAKPMTDFDEEVRGSLTLSTLGRQSKGKRKKLQWRRCFSGWRRQKIHPAPPEHFEEAFRSASADLTGSPEDSCQTLCPKEMSSSTSCSSAL